MLLLRMGRHARLHTCRIDPLAYAQRGILVNEFRDQRWQVGHVAAGM